MVSRLQSFHLTLQNMLQRKKFLHLPALEPSLAMLVHYCALQVLHS